MLKEKQKSSTKNTSEVRAYLIILLVLIPYFLCVTGVMYNIFGIPGAITLNSEGEQYDVLYLHDQESYSAKWLKDYAQKYRNIYTDHYGLRRVMSQGKISLSAIDSVSLIKHRNINGYIYLRYQNVVAGELVDPNSEVYSYNMTDYQDVFTEKSEIYDSGCSRIYL